MNKALALPTSSALQFYMIMSGQERPFRLSIAELKSWLGIPAEKYRKDGKDRIDHLEERVLRPVKRMLDETCPYTFTYEKLRENPNNCKSPVVGFELMPVCLSREVQRPRIGEGTSDSKGLVGLHISTGDELHEAADGLRQK